MAARPRLSRRDTKGPCTTARVLQTVSEAFERLKNVLFIVCPLFFSSPFELSLRPSELREGWCFHLFPHDTRVSVFLCFCQMFIQIQLFIVHVSGVGGGQRACSCINPGASLFLRRLIRAISGILRSPF